MSRVASRFLVVAMATLLATGWLTARPLPVKAAGTISLATLGVAYGEEFNTLATLGSSNSAVPNGWDFRETGTNANGLYAAGTGSNTAGDTYSFGSGADSLDRAFGGLLSGSLVPTVGASFTNNTGATIGRLDIAYVGEQWRLGALPTSGTPVRGPDRLDFQYSLDATSLATGTWIDASTLDFVSPTTAPVGAQDGNAAANRTAIASAVTGLSIANGATFWIRWSDFNVASSDDGLAVDEFFLTPQAAEDVAPQVSATTPADNADNVAEAANIDITFSEPVSTTAAGFDITCGTSGAHTAALSGGPTTWTLNPDTNFAQLESCTVTVDAGGVTDVDANDPPNTMAADYVFDFQIGPECDDTFTPIYAIQGSGTAAAITGNVSTEGVVVGDFEGPIAGGLQGIYIQDPSGDDDGTTSDGIFVFTGNNLNGVVAGDFVRVTGFARERFNETALNGSNDNNDPVVKILDCGEGGSITPVQIEMPFSSNTYLERFEGMRVTFPQPLVIAEYFGFEQFGELVISLPLEGETRPFTPTSIDEPGGPAIARALANSLRRITLDDGIAGQNPASVRHPNGAPFSLANRFRGGDHVANATGVLGFAFSLYRIQPTGPADYTPQNPRPAAPEDVGGRLTVSAMNTLNFFITADFPSGNPNDNKCGHLNTLECRGWDNPADPASDPIQDNEFQRQRDKLLQALAGIDADVLGLNELENSAGVDPLGDPEEGIVAGLNDIFGAGTYAAINTGTIGTDAIKVGLIYKPGVVTPVGSYETLDSADDPRFVDTRSRPALAQTFEENATGERFTVVVNHLKSKGSACGAGDPDAGDGQGNCNGTRELAAQALVDWLATDPTDSGDPDFLIAGDLNSYAMEDPIDAIKAGPDDVAGTDDDYTNLIAEYQGTYAYSYTFDGQAGYLDHSLAGATLVGQVTGAAEWHINSDEPDILDYDVSFKPSAVDQIYEPNQYRTSDHDPVLVGLELNAPPVFEIVAGVSCSPTGNGGSFLVSVDDLQTAPGDLTLALTGNTNTSLVPNGNVTTGSGANRTVAITAAKDTSGSAVLTFSLSDGVNTVTFDINVQIGTDLGDTLTGTAGSDLLVGAQGSDNASGLGGVDVLCGGNGNDVLSGGDGDDLLDGAKGEDTLSGDAGDDTLRGGQGVDSLTGGADADSFSGGAGVDTNTDFSPGQDTSDGT